MDSTIISALIGVVSGLLGVLVGGRLSKSAALSAAESSNKNAINMMRRQEVNRAAADLRGSFAKILTGIRTNKLSSEADIRGFALTSFDTHAIEMGRFRFYIPSHDRENYDKACEEYQDMVYMRPINHGSNLPADKLYVEKVEAILKYANP